MTKKKTTAKAEVKEEVKTPEVETPKVEELKEEVKEEKKANVIWSIKGWKEVHQDWFLKIQAVRWQAVDKSKLPEDIQRWLTNKGYGTNVYLMPKEWLEKRKVDPEMLAKLKKFISDNFIN